MGKELNISNPFADAPEPTHESVMAPLMGIASPLDQIPRNVVARPVSIFDIQRDPLQPRRAIPSAALVGWDGTTADIPGVLARWYELARKQAAGPFEVADYLDGEGRAEVTGPVADSFVALLALAKSILADGLSNPILITQDKRIESGERRWLAYHVLYTYTGEERWSKIPAREAARSLWRQAAENGARESLNAISRARQLALLLMDLYKGRYEFEPYTFHPGQCDQAYYAQVADGGEFPVPTGAVNQLLAVMGLKNGVQLRQYRGLLRVPMEVWQQADDENWPEPQLRRFIGKQKRVTQVTRPKIKLTKDLLPKWMVAQQIVAAEKPGATDQDVLTRMIEFYLQYKGRDE